MRNQPLFQVTNHHGETCGVPPQIDEQTFPGVYRSYFESQHGEQAIFLYDYEQEYGMLYLGDAGSEAFSSSFSLIMLEQLDQGASTGLVQVENQGKGHVGHRCGSSGGYWSSVTISLTRRQSSVPWSVQIPAPQ